MRLEIIYEVLNEAARREKVIRDLVLEALEIDGEHHKQWYLEKILDLVADAPTRDLLMVKHKWEEGIAP